MQIGFVGLGSMGAQMAARLAVDGDTVLAYDLDPGAVERVASDSIRGARSVREVAEGCDLVLSMVWDDRALHEVVLGSDGLLAARRFAGCFVDLSTTSVAAAIGLGHRLRDRNATFLDAAVIGGGVPAARAGTSPLVVAGPREAFDMHAPVLRRMGSCDYVGGLGRAKAAKIINNLLVGVVTLINAEALSMGMKAGLNLSTMVDLLADGGAGSTVLRSYMGRYLREGVYGEGLIGHQLMAKDLRLAGELADQLGAPGFGARLARQLYLACASAQGPSTPFPSAFEFFRGASATSGLEGLS